MQYPMIGQPQSAFAPTGMAKGGLTDIAKTVRAQGRNNDTMLVHMTPREVRGLQSLAQAHGGSLTVNPKTGLPEAGFLDAIMPMVLGFGLNMLVPGLGALGSAALVGGGTAAATGDLGKGLMAGLGAFGGANLGASFAATGTDALTAAANAPAAAGTAPLGTTATAGAEGLFGATPGQTAALEGVLPNAGATAAGTTAGTAATPGLAQAAPASAFGPSASQAAEFNSIFPSASQAGTTAAQTAATAPAMATPPSQWELAKTGMQDLGSEGGVGRFGTEFAKQSGGGTMAMLSTAPTIAGVAESLSPTPEVEEKKKSWNYQGPYKPSTRTARNPYDRGANDSSEFRYFDVVNPSPGYQPINAAQGGLMSLRGYAEGGVPTEDRAIRQPGAGFVGGTMPEFNYNFRPVEIEGFTQQPKELQVDTSGGIGNMVTSLMDAISESKYPDMKDYVYDPNTQRMVKKAASGGLQALASGGGVNLDDGGFVFDARTVSEAGNGSTRAGERVLSQKFNARPIRGSGDGVSDSIGATIGGNNPARVADGEMHVSKEDVQRAGGAKKLYAFMDKAEKARKQAKRGQDTGLRALKA